MTAAAALRRAIAAHESALADLRAALADLDGAPVAPIAPAPDTGVTDILTAQHVTIAQLAEKLRTSEKTARGIGNAAGARVQVGGRVLFDIAVVRRHVASANYRVLPCSSLSIGEQINEDVTMTNEVST